jgi:alpha-glucuronidase
MNYAYLDEMWLSQDKAKELLGAKVFQLNTDVENNITSCIRSEILNFLGAELTTDIKKAKVILNVNKEINIEKDGFEILVSEDMITINSSQPVGVLYGIYAVIRQLIHVGELKNEISIPTNYFRMINHWDNFDGSIERGYAGQSFFYSNNQFLDDIDKLRAYARFLASVGINAIAVNNVNVKKEEMKFLINPYFKHIKLMNDIFEEYGIKTYLCVNFSSPIAVGKLDTADPLDEDVKKWWQDIVDGIYQEIPTFGGLLVKADSEGEPGPYDYGRSQADGANTLAAALSKHGGTLIWRAFVYNCKQDWRDRTTDRAKASYEVFMELDGKFKDNVILQIKFGPHDFQVGEPPHPLFGRLKHTNEIIEFQITQEYTGQQIDLNYLALQWQEILEFNTNPLEKNREIKYVMETDSPLKHNSGFAAVVNVGDDDNWTGNKLAQSNLYAFGRLAWDYSLDSNDILKEWIDLTFTDLEGPEKEVIFSILSTSNETYEYYTSPLGIGWMVNSKNAHYGPGLNDHEYSRWGTYHFADRNGLGVDRTEKTGSGYTRQYVWEVSEMFENLETCPERWLLFFHHVPYTHKLKNGKTVIQYIYDVHFQGVENVERYINEWASLEGKVNDIAFENVKSRLELQLRDAIEWRDQINTFFYRFSGIEDVERRTIYK